MHGLTQLWIDADEYQEHPSALGILPNLSELTYDESEHMNRIRSSTTQYPSMHC